ncbi:MAG: SusC/RagA family TonB-linked outer membrane protein [Bacteroidota bacterium]
MGLIVGLSGVVPGGTLLAEKVQEVQRSTHSDLTYEEYEERTEVVWNSNPIITLSFESIPLKEALIRVGREARAGVYFDTGIIPDRNVSLEANRMRLTEVLRILLDGTNLEPQSSGRNIMIRVNERIQSLSQLADRTEDRIQLSVSGRVQDAETEEPLPGVNVVIQGTSTGTVTDTEGYYEIDIPREETILVYSFIGYANQEVSVQGRSEINVLLEPGVDELGELVVVGYGEQRRRDLTGSIASVPRQELVEVPVYSMDNVLQGRVSGVEVIADGYRPGEESTIRIRGERSLVAGNDPLIVMDGVPISGGLMDLNPSDIESIEVLKDASATAIYGSRGSNGVILVTTRRGSPGETLIEYSGQVGFQEVTNTVDMMDAEQYIEMQREAARQQGVYTTDQDLFNDWELEGIANGVDTDWQKEAFGGRGSQQNHQLSVRGGTETTRYAISTTMTEHIAMVQNNDYSRFVGRVNIDQEVTDYFQAGLSTQVSFSRQHQGGNFRHMIMNSPLDWPGRAESALVNEFAVGENFPLLETKREFHLDRRDRTRVIANVYGIVNITDDLTYRLNFAPDLSFTERGVHSWQNSTASIDSDRGQDVLFENILDFNREIAMDHIVGATALYSIQTNSQVGSNLSVRGLPYESQRFYNLGTAEETTGRGSFIREWTLESYMLRLNYSYLGRYLFTATGRVDGSSRLAEGNKYGLFPSVAVGWLIVDEPFMERQDLFSELKLRVSYGDVGNTGIEPYQTQGRLARTGYAFGDRDVFGFEHDELANTELRWERTRQFDIGLDFGILEHRISGTLGVYQQNTVDLIMNRQLPPTSGFLSTLENVGATRNRGLEVSLETINIERGGVRGMQWTTDIHFHANRNEITELYGGTEDDPGSGWFIGQPVNIHYDYEFAGIWQQDEAQEAADYGAQPGEIKLRDVNGDGQIGAADRVILGTYEPDYTASISNRFSYKGVDLSFLVYAVQGRTIFSQVGETSLSGFINLRRGYNHNSMDVDYWTPQNPSNEYPRPRFAGHDYSTPMGYFDGSYIRLRNVTLGYSLPRNWLDRMGLRDARIHATGQNLYTITDFPGLDPEGARGEDMPNYRTFLIGIDIGL